MSPLLYTSCSHQRKLSLQAAVAAAERVAECLQSNPVLRAPEVSAVPYAQTGSLLCVRAEVEANSANQLGILMALNAADEQWCYGLADADCVPCTGPSQLRVQGYAC